MLSLLAAARGRPLVIGHRGASGEAPENTLAAFRLAVEHGADLIEFDVQLTADGVPVVIHDPTVDRTTDGHALVTELTLAQIEALDAGAKFGPRFAGERIPSLDEVLAWAAGTVPVAIEIKHDGPLYQPEIVARVAEALRRCGMADSAIVISFDHVAVLRARELCPEVAGGVLFACLPVAPSALALAARADALLPHVANLTPGMVADAHAHGLAVAPWVADDERTMRWALSLGVDALGTNFPERLATILRSWDQHGSFGAHGGGGS